MPGVGSARVRAASSRERADPLSSLYPVIVARRAKGLDLLALVESFRAIADEIEAEADAQGRG